MFPIRGDRKKQKASTLSGGERQMLAISRALMPEPKMLLLDEPTAALAPMVADEVLQKLADVQDTGVTLLIAEQNARKALALADRGLVLVQGQKAFDGDPETISKDEDMIMRYLGALITTQVTSANEEDSAPSNRSQM